MRINLKITANPINHRTLVMSEDEKNVSDRYSQMSAKECCKLMERTSEYWDIYSQCNHTRWAKFRSFGRDWDIVSREIYCKYLEDGDEELRWISRMFSIAYRKLTEMSSPGPEKEQAL